MSGAAMNKILISLATVAFSAALLSACGSQPTKGDLSKAPLAGAKIGGDFTLIDQNGKLRSRSEFDGKWRMVYFGYTYCPDICTPDVQNLMAGLNMFAAQQPELADKIHYH